MYTAGYTSTETVNDDPEIKRVWNMLFGRRQSVDTDLSVMVFRGEPGCWFRSHAHDMEQIFFIIEGRVEITIDGETRVIEPRELVYVPRNVVHSGRNVGDGPLEFLIIDHWPEGSTHRFGL